MSASSTLRTTGTTKLWTCCQCDETRISMRIGDCPSCEHPRCIDCGVKSHVSTSPEDGEDAKFTRRVAESSHRPVQPTFPPPNLLRGNQPQSFTTTSETRNLTEQETPRRVSPLRNSFKVVRVQDAANHSIHVLRDRSASDNALISIWHEMLPVISSSCARYCSTLSSIHLFRYGADEATSKPTVIVNSRIQLRAEEMSALQISLQQTILGACMWNSEGVRSLSDPLIVQLLFKISRLRRSVASPPHEETLPPICEPRNRKFNVQPETGDSIGLSGSFVDTVTLGCYLVAGRRPVILTVDHLLPQHYALSYLTHLSLQDRRDLLVPILNKELRQILSTSSHTCDFCAQVSGVNPNALTELELSTYTTMFLQFENVHRLPPCQIEVELKLATHTARHEQQAEPLGSLKCRSFQRSIPCPDGPGYTREMDWATYDLANHEQRHMLRRQHKHPNITAFAREMILAHTMVPGAQVKSIGRTSGHQVGQISNTPSAVFHENYTTHEWCVLRRAETTVDDWVEGGIGVEGDSGALIVDEATNEVYGMLWGRIGDGAETVTLFTPMVEILRDIQTTRDVENGRPTHPVVLLRGQTMPDQEPTSIPSSVVPNVPIPVEHQEEEKAGDESIDFLSSTFSFSSLEAQASTSPPRRHPLQRYRTSLSSDTVRNAQNAPRSFGDNEDVGHEPTRWLGTHTYFRYAIADEVE